MSDTTDKYRSNSQQRILKVLMALSGNEIEGLEPSALSKGLNVQASAVTRDLANLALAGLAEKMESGNWRLTPKMIQMAVAFQDRLARQHRKLDEVRNRYTRDPK